MKILLLDDEEIYYTLLKYSFPDHEVHYEENPIIFLDQAFNEKRNLNEFDLILCDYFFDNLSMNAFELKLSIYIRELGFKNKLILYSNLNSFKKDELQEKYLFDDWADKGKPFRFRS